MTKKNKGMTLIEMMVVIVLLGLVMTLLASKFLGQMSGGKIKIAKIQLHTLDDKIQLFYLNENRYPTQEEGLAILTQASSKLGNHPYVDKREQLKDPWGNQVLYEIPGPEGKAYNLLSLGSDGKRGGDGDAKDLSIWDDEDEKK